MSNLNKFQSIRGKYVTGFKDDYNEKSVHWCSIGQVSVEKARQFAQDIINMSDTVEKDDWD